MLFEFIVSLSFLKLFFFINKMTLRPCLFLILFLIQSLILSLIFFEELWIFYIHYINLLSFYSEIFQVHVKSFIFIVGIYIVFIQFWVSCSLGLFFTNWTCIIYWCKTQLFIINFQISWKVLFWSFQFRI